MDYQLAQSKLATARSESNGKPIANNTRIVRDGDRLAIRLHDTNVVTFAPNGDVILNSGGWRTVTTKDRINEYARPARVWSGSGVWYVYYFERDYVYLDGITLHADGTVSGAGDESENNHQLKLRRAIRAYAKEYVRKLYAREIPPPSNGDCWGCLMVDENGNTAIARDHIEHHIDDKYYVPSLVIRALSTGVSQAARNDVAVCLKYGGATGNELLWDKDGNGFIASQIRKAIVKWCYRECGI